MENGKIIQQINESKVNQELRNHILGNQESCTFKALEQGGNDGTITEAHKKAYENYNSMDEANKQSFTNKGWKNG